MHPRFRGPRRAAFFDAITARCETTAAAHNALSADPYVACAVGNRAGRNLRRRLLLWQLRRRRR
eukprot:1031696-Lingulodinium_polyedra.AAC.1